MNDALGFMDPNQLLSPGMIFYNRPPEQVIAEYEMMYFRDLTTTLPTDIRWNCSNRDSNYRLSSPQLERILRLGSGLAVIGMDVENNFTILSDNLRRPYFGIKPLYAFEEKNFTIPGAENPGAPNIIVTNKVPIFSFNRRVSPIRSLNQLQAPDLQLIRVAAQELAILRYLRDANAVQLNTQVAVTGETTMAAKAARDELASLKPFIGIVPLEQGTDEAASFLKNRIESIQLAAADNMLSFSQQMDVIKQDLRQSLAIPTMENKAERRITAEVEALNSVPQTYADSYITPRKEVAEQVRESYGYDLNPAFTMLWKPPTVPGMPEEQPQPDQQMQQ